jgi:hypothetical protein
VSKVELLEEVVAVVQVSERFPSAVHDIVTFPMNVILQFTTVNTGVDDLIHLVFLMLVHGDRWQGVCLATRDSILVVVFE